jgi:D-alanine-D-alanine ligase
MRLPQGLRNREFRDVVIVIDARTLSSDAPMHLRRDLEMTSAQTVDEILSAINLLGVDVHVYAGPAEFGAEAARHKQDIVWPLYSGQISRNRSALVPAICETYGLRYVGPDVYGHMICQDKEVATNLARSIGLTTPWHRVIRSIAQIDSMRQFPLPFVVKPLLEGSSIGISQRNLIRDHATGIEIASEILDLMDQPVLVEQFVGGREVSYNFLRDETMNHWAYSEIYVEHDDDYFASHLFDAEEKIKMTLPRSVRVIDDLLPECTRKRIDRFIEAVGAITSCRIAGKHCDGRFILLEATPDAHLWEGGAFAAGFIHKGWSYVELIGTIIHGAVRFPPYLSTNGLGTGDSSQT